MGKHKDTSLFETEDYHKEKIQATGLKKLQYERRSLNLSAKRVLLPYKNVEDEQQKAEEMADAYKTLVGDGHQLPTLDKYLDGTVSLNESALDPRNKDSPDLSSAEANAFLIKYKSNPAHEPKPLLAKGELYPLAFYRANQFVAGVHKSFVVMSRYNANVALAPNDLLHSLLQEFHFIVDEFRLLFMKKKPRSAAPSAVLGPLALTDGDRIPEYSAANPPIDPMLVVQRALRGYLPDGRQGPQPPVTMNDWALVGQVTMGSQYLQHQANGRNQQAMLTQQQMSQNALLAAEANRSREDTIRHQATLDAHQATLALFLQAQQQNNNNNNNNNSINLSREDRAFIAGEFRRADANRQREAQESNAFVQSKLQSIETIARSQVRAPGPNPNRSPMNQASGGGTNLMGSLNNADMDSQGTTGTSAPAEAVSSGESGAGVGDTPLPTEPFNSAPPVNSSGTTTPMPVVGRNDPMAETVAENGERLDSTVGSTQQATNPPTVLQNGVADTPLRRSNGPPIVQTVSENGESPVSSIGSPTLQQTAQGHGGTVTHGQKKKVSFADSDEDSAFYSCTPASPVSVDDDAEPSGDVPSGEVPAAVAEPTVLPVSPVSVDDDEDDEDERPTDPAAAAVAEPTASGDYDESDDDDDESADPSATGCDDDDRGDVDDIFEDEVPTDPESVASTPKPKKASWFSTFRSPFSFRKNKNEKENEVVSSSDESGQEMDASSQASSGSFDEEVFVSQGDEVEFDDDTIAQFVNATGCPFEDVNYWLNLTGGDVDDATTVYLEHRGPDDMGADGMGHGEEVEWSDDKIARFVHSTGCPIDDAEAWLTHAGGDLEVAAAGYLNRMGQGDASSDTDISDEDDAKEGKSVWREQRNSSSSDSSLTSEQRQESQAQFPTTQQSDAAALPSTTPQKGGLARRLLGALSSKKKTLTPSKKSPQQQLVAARPGATPARPDATPMHWGLGTLSSMEKKTPPRRGKKSTGSVSGGGKKSGGSSKKKTSTGSLSGSKKSGGTSKKTTPSPASGGKKPGAKQSKSALFRTSPRSGGKKFSWATFRSPNSPKRTEDKADEWNTPKLNEDGEEIVSPPKKNPLRKALEFGATVETAAVEEEKVEEPTVDEDMVEEPAAATATTPTGAEDTIPGTPAPPTPTEDEASPSRSLFVKRARRMSKKVRTTANNVAKAISPKNFSPKKLVQRGRSKKGGPTRPNWCEELAKGEHAHELGGRWFVLVSTMSRGTLIVPNGKTGKPCGKCRKSLKKASAEYCHHHTQAGENLQGSFGNQLPALDDE